MSRRGRGAVRTPLSRDVVVDEAIAFFDDDDTSQLTMRALGTRLGVEAMSLYRYVNGREDLLEAVVATIMDQVEASPPADSARTEDWHGYLRWMARSVRDVSLQHPAIFLLMATRHPAAAWLRPPLRSLRVVEGFLAALIDRGFTDDRAVQIYCIFSSFLLGHLLLEIGQRGMSTSPIDDPVEDGEGHVPNRDHRLDASVYPTVLRLRPQLSEDHTTEEFERTLEALLRRLDPLVSPGRCVATSPVDREGPTRTDG